MSSTRASSSPACPPTSRSCCSPCVSRPVSRPSIDAVSGGRREQLWVRVFPDTVSIDAFGEELSDSEVADAEKYWAEVWAAAGNEDGERAAWHKLVGSHGSGRAAWIVATLPTDE